MREPLIVKKHAALARAITLSEAAGAIGTAHLLRAVRDGRVHVISLPPGTSNVTFKACVRAVPAGRPAIVLLGDDEGLNRGPAGWPMAERAVAWARTIIIHAAGAEVAHYEAAVLAAELLERVLFIECGTATAPAWVRLVKPLFDKGLPSLVILPRNGAVHPVPLDRSVLH